MKVTLANPSAPGHKFTLVNPPRTLLHRMAAWLGLLLLTCTAFAQGTLFVYDQQSADENTGGGGGYLISSLQPAQSFTPTLTSLDFVRMCFGDGDINGQGATVYVNILSNSITGPVVASSAPVFLPDRFGASGGLPGYTNFFFSASVPLTPGTTYFLQPVLQSGDTAFSVTGYTYGYPGGTMYLNGNPAANDLWFREGIIAPEPGTLALGVVGLGALAYARRRFRKS